MGHTHSHGHHHDVPPQKNSALYFRVSHVGAVIVWLTLILMLWADSHAAFGDWIHGVADVGTIYLMAYMSKLCQKGEISPHKFDRLVGFFNTVFLFISAGAIYLETALADHHTTFFGMVSTGIVMLVGSWYQHRLLHEAHGHEHHGPTGVSGFKSIDQHFLVDMFMAACVIGVALWRLGELPGYLHADIRMAELEAIVIVLLGCRNVLDIYRGKKVHV